jgi:hypothetical protein
MIPNHYFPIANKNQRKKCGYCSESMGIVMTDGGIDTVLPARPLKQKPNLKNKKRRNININKTVLNPNPSYKIHPKLPPKHKTWLLNPK